MYDPLNVELPAGYAAFATYGQRTSEIAVELHWREELTTALMEVEIQSFNPVDKPEVETAYANARAFDSKREDVAALTRTALQPVLNDWQRLRGSDTTFPGTGE